MSPPARIGTSFSFLAQITLSAAVWVAYTQWLWRSVEKHLFKVNALNAMFAADTCLRSLFNLQMLSKFKLGSIMALIAWYGHPTL